MKGTIFNYIQIFWPQQKHVFILLLRKGVSPYEYMDDWEKSNEASLPETRFLHSLKYGRYYWCRLYVSKNRLCKDFEITKVRRISRFACSKWYIIFSWCIWEL